MDEAAWGNKVKIPQTKVCRTTDKIDVTPTNSTLGVRSVH
jgi:hypothetical protein